MNIARHLSFKKKSQCPGLILQTICHATLFLLLFVGLYQEGLIKKSPNAAPITLDLGDLLRPNNASEANPNIKYLDAINFMNWSKEVSCTPKVTFSGDALSTVRLSLDCYPRIYKPFENFTSDPSALAVWAILLALCVHSLLVWQINNSDNGDFDSFPFMASAKKSERIIMLDPVKLKTNTNV